MPRCAVVAEFDGPAADLDGGAPRFLGLEPLPWVARRGDVEKPRRFLALGPPPRTRATLAIRAPAAGAAVAGGVVPTLEVDATGATIDGREVAACYAVLDRKCCALLWTAPGPLRADDALPADAAPVFERLDLPPGDHELVAWLEHANGTLVAFDSVRFGVVGVVS